MDWAWCFWCILHRTVVSNWVMNPAAVSFCKYIDRSMDRFCKIVLQCLKSKYLTLVYACFEDIFSDTSRVFLFIRFIFWLKLIAVEIHIVHFLIALGTFSYCVCNELSLLNCPLKLSEKDLHICVIEISASYLYSVVISVDYLVLKFVCSYVFKVEVHRLCLRLIIGLKQSANNYRPLTDYWFLEVLWLIAKFKVLLSNDQFL